MNPLSPLAAVGRSVLALLQQIGQISLFAANTLSHLVRHRSIRVNFYQHCFKLDGYRCRLSA